MRLPKWTLLVCVLATVIFLVPALKDTMIYDRDAIISGQWWRLITGNLVHLSLMHFTYDALALLVIGTAAEIGGVRYLWLVYATAAIVIGCAVFIASPELRFFGGLSGIVSATLVYLCLWGIRTGVWRSFFFLVLVLAFVKIGLEFLLGESLLSATEHQPFIPSPVSHLAGAATGVLVFLQVWLYSTSREIISPTTARIRLVWRLRKKLKSSNCM